MNGDSQYWRSIIRKTTMSLFVTLVMSVCQAYAQPNPVDAYIVEKMKQYRISGLAILVLQNGNIVKKSNYGIANIEFNIPVTDSSVFQIASVTKLFTSSIVMKLVEEGKLSLDQSISEFVDNIPEGWRSITVRHLLNHTSGIRNYFRTKQWVRMRCPGSLNHQRHHRNVSDRTASIRTGV